WMIASAGGCPPSCSGQRSHPVVASKTMRRPKARMSGISQDNEPTRNGMAARPHRLRNIIGGSAGNLVEWYDWYAYSAAALYFAPIFFPSGDRTAQLLNAAAVFAVGFVMRPIGAWLMGIYADRLGRKAALSLSVAMMCAGSLLIAVLPGYAQIGAF